MLVPDGVSHCSGTQPRLPKNMSSKSKMVSFRLPHAEYLRLQQSCTAVGVRNISELARAAMQHLVESPDPDRATLHTQVAALRSKMNALSTELDRIARQIGPPKV